mmetsp:Transcript_13365/g.14873  ORF Transcript_13365/g.14873 Transcript_13365/m.14873 type:complete len:118 (+) Transcript_13365:98-451(+)
MRYSVLSFLATVLVIDIASCYNVPSAPIKSRSFSRREAFVPLVGAAFSVLVPPLTAQAAEDGGKKEQKPSQAQQNPSETEEEKKKRIMKEKIAASKLNYRKPEGDDKLPFRLLNQKN